MHETAIRTQRDAYARPDVCQTADGIEAQQGNEEKGATEGRCCENTLRELTAIICRRPLYASASRAAFRPRAGSVGIFCYNTGWE